MKILKIFFIALFLNVSANFAFAEEPVKCNDIKTYIKKMKCKMKSAKNIIGSKVTSSAKKIKDDTSKSFSILKKNKE